jgi:hypothetical protein
MTFTGYSQGSRTALTVLRVSEDNDFINIRFSGTDKAYTHGFRAELLYTLNEGTTAFGEEWTFKAGNKSVDTYAWSVVQTMVTPGNLSNPGIEASDYRYACSITFHRTRHSSNPERKYNLQTEYVVGFRGPIALGKETQTFMHRLIDDELPQGWNNQLKTSLLLNVNLAIEKQLLTIEKRIELIGGSKLFVGTSRTAMSTYSLIRIGKMDPYFNAYLTQFLTDGKSKHRWRAYVVVLPSLDFVIWNALVQSGMPRPKDKEVSHERGLFPVESPRKHNQVGCDLAYGFVLSSKKVSITFTQHDLYARLKGQTRHAVGNIAINIAL